mmetsp:Transcript_24601/g.38206  ORF Transcript_24601/g.38206 Transcript_24601/m.38206 type:complete len:107 (+) Transcript_24601:147-467(+)
MMFDIDSQFFDAYFSNNGGFHEEAETAGERMHNLKLIVNALVEFYLTDSSIDLYSEKVLENLRKNENANANLDNSGLQNDPLLFLNVDKLIATEQGMSITDCDAML